MSSRDQKLVSRMIIALIMLALLGGLLAWQERRYELVEECHAAGGHWVGWESRCRPVPKIYIERGLKRS